MRWLMDRIGRLLRSTQARPVDRAALRAEMTSADPDFARVREVQHDALNTLTAQRAADGMAIRREREFWTRHPPHA